MATRISAEADLEFYGNQDAYTGRRDNGLHRGLINWGGELAGQGIRLGVPGARAVGEGEVESS